ncbi:MAG: IclR family transcriptional regulator [Parvibaculaceae bacterium]|nr:IclR family transcriptional regulator [Parvibaculaceae bacterium]
MMGGKEAQTKIPKAAKAVETAPKYSAPALEKGLDIIEFLSSSDTDYTLAEIASKIGRTKGEIFRMLAVLEMRGYVVRVDDADKYQVTDKLFQLGLRRPKYKSLAYIATPLMEVFAEETRYPCHLAIPTGSQIAVITRVDCPDPVGVTVRVGYRQPLLETGSGLCLLAFMSSANRGRAINAIKEDNPWVNVDEVEAKLIEIRQEKCLIEPSKIMDGVWDISCPILGANNGGAVAALTVPYVKLVTNPIAPEAVADHLNTAASRIAQALTS